MLREIVCENFSASQKLLARSLGLDEHVAHDQSSYKLRFGPIKTNFLDGGCGQVLVLPSIHKWRLLCFLAAEIKKRANIDSGA